MKNVLSWLAGLFHVEVIWIDKGRGRWTKRRRFHPAVNFAAFVCVLFFAAACGSYYFRSAALRESRKSTEYKDLRLSSPASITAAPAGRETGLGIHDFMSEPMTPEPGPIPSELAVDDGEYWVRIDKGDYMLYLYRGPDVDKSYRVAVGKNPGDKERVGDNRTPNGIFTVQSIENASAWTHDFGDGKGVVKGAYGPWFIRLRTGWKGIGIHGTHDPDSRGSMASEGCVRMLNGELEELKSFAFKDMKVVIEE